MNAAPAGAAAAFPGADALPAISHNRLLGHGVASLRFDADGYAHIGGGSAGFTFAPNPGRGGAARNGRLLSVHG